MSSPTYHGRAHSHDGGMLDEEPNHSQPPKPFTPTSNAAPTKATKDRSCPFCCQAFTSSSLGRHLDLYIKPKNPKPPDGVHHVDEIRKIRGNITRRQPRNTKASVDANSSGSSSAGGNNNISNTNNNHNKREKTSEQREDSPENTPSHTGDSRLTRQASQAVDGSSATSPMQSNEPYDTGLFPAASWHVTGVINNLPPRLPSRNVDTPPDGLPAQRAPETRWQMGTNPVLRPEQESESIWELQQDARLGRAAEMALREVLGSLEAAQKREEPKTVFDELDFFSLSFPGLCLAILPSPGTLFTPTPFPSAESWTLGPPGVRQYESLTRVLNERIAVKRQVVPLPESVALKHHSHVSGAWEHWQNLSDSDRASAWTLETLRSFSRGKDEQKKLRSELERWQQHARQLETRYDRLSKCQLPRDYLLHPPHTIPISPSVMREVNSTQFASGIAEHNYDAEALLSKWRAAIRAMQRLPGAAKQPGRQSHEMSATAKGPDPFLRALVITGSVSNVGGPVPRHWNAPEESFEHRGEATSVSYETPPSPGVANGLDESMVDAHSTGGVG